jgi:hypothetical protein
LRGGQARKHGATRIGQIEQSTRISHRTHTRLVAARDQVSIGQSLHIPRGPWVGQLLGQRPSHVHPHKGILVGGDDLTKSQQAEGTQHDCARLMIATKAQKTGIAKYRYAPCLSHTHTCYAPQGISPLVITTSNTSPTLTTGQPSPCFPPECTVHGTRCPAGPRIGGWSVQIPHCHPDCALWWCLRITAHMHTRVQHAHMHAYRAQLGINMRGRCLTTSHHHLIHAPSFEVLRNPMPGTRARARTADSWSSSTRTMEPARQMRTRYLHHAHT